MRGILLKRFFRCRALSSVPHVWMRKRRSSFPLPQVKRQKLLSPVFSHQASREEEDEEAGGDGSEDEEEEEEEALDEDVESEESAGGSEELPEFLVKAKKDVDVSSVPQARERPSVYP